jgi:hypothetical protein
MLGCVYEVLGVHDFRGVMTGSDELWLCLVVLGDRVWSTWCLSPN